LNGGSLVGVVPGDIVTLSQSGVYVSKSPGSSVAVNATDSLSGASAGDYTLLEPTDLSGSITPASVSVSGTTVGAKIYNGNTSAPLLGGTLSGVIPGDSVTLIQAGNFASASVGTGVAVTAADSLAGADARDYSVTQPTGLSGTISPASTSNTPGTAGAPSPPLLAANNVAAQVDSNFIYPQLGATSQVIDASPSIVVVQSESEPSSDSSGADDNASSTKRSKAIAVNVSMKIGASGTLKIVGGGLNLPRAVTAGTP
jgi:hypothetical protein